MAWYRFTAPVRQTDFVEFGLEIGLVCSHLKNMSIGINDIRLRAGKLAFDTTVDLSAENVEHLGLEAG